MPWSAPTSSDLQVRFPAFNDVDNELIDALLEEAEVLVGPSWIESDRTPAILYYVAHTLAMEGHGGAQTGSGPVDPVTGAEIKTRSVGDTTTTFVTSSDSKKASVGSSQGFGATLYGTRYLELMRRSFPAILAV